MPADRPVAAAPPAELAETTPQIVAIGASAGGLEALEKLFAGLSSASGATFVVIQHLSPDHKSMMANLLARHTDMPVVMVEQDMPIEPNRVYLIPPGSIMHIGAGKLTLTPKNPRTLTLPIDVFFKSMAEHYGARSVGVVLSGTGSVGAVTVNAGATLSPGNSPGTLTTGAVTFNGGRDALDHLQVHVGGIQCQDAVLVDDGVVEAKAAE
jgi:two-component system CheB/CheR fusion protein